MSYDESLISGLIFDCPERWQLETCCFYEIRKVPLKQRLEWMKNLSPEMKRALFAKHQSCLKEF